MTTLDTLELMNLNHYLQRAESLIQVLNEAVTQSGNEHHALLAEIIEEYLHKSKQIINQH